MIQTVAFPDTVLWVAGYLQDVLPDRSEPYADSVEVGVIKPIAGRSVAVNRDGGPAARTRDYVRLRARVWADTWQEASDLAYLVRSLLLASPGEGPVVAASSTSGPSDVPDSTQFQFMFSVDLTVRGTNL